MASDLDSGSAETQGAQSATDRQNARLNLLLEFTNRITSSLDIHDLVRATAASIRELMGCDFVHVGMTAANGDKHEVVEDSASAGLKQGLSLSPSGALMEAFEAHKPVLLKEMKPENHPPEMYELIVKEGIRSVWRVPLVSRGRLLGALGLSWRREDVFSQEDDAEFLMRVGGQIAIAVENALAFREISELKEKLAQEKLYLEEEIRSEMNFDQIVGRSEALQHVLQLVDTVGQTDSTVLLMGETGTGKELIARAVHEHSKRKSRTFVKLNCAAIPTGLLESELFGHEKGAFTGAIAQKVGRMELADQGTLFLDEVGDIPIEIQPKLLRALQEREFERLGGNRTKQVDVRVVAATNRDLEQMMENREFRSDLYYRLNVFPIRIPALRERPGDIPLLVRYFTQKYGRRMQRQIESIPIAAMRKLSSWHWPGNIRELENFIERSVILTRGSALQVPLGELRKTIYEAPTLGNAKSSQQDIADIVKETIQALNSKKTVMNDYAGKQREEIVGALTASKGRVGGEDGAASRMGIKRSTLLSRIKKFGINPKQYA